MSATPTDIEPQTSHDPNGESAYRRDVQGLRAIAVILVILAHAKVGFFGGGFIGVDVFFVISGFVITGLLLRQPAHAFTRNLGIFYARRIRRIMPAATVVLIATVVATYYWLGAYSGVQLDTDVRWASLFSANFHFISLGTNYFTAGLPPSLILHYWSLAVEEQFYFFWPLVVFTIALIVRGRHHRWAVSAALVAVIAASAWWSYHETLINSVTAYYSPFTRFWELAVGALVATIPLSPRAIPAWFRALIGWAAIVVIGWCSVKMTDLGVPGTIMWWPVGATALLIYTGGNDVAYSPSLHLATKPFTWVGDRSYSLYLWHYGWLMIPAAFATTPMSASSRAEQILGALVCSMLSYDLIENPLRRSTFLNRHPWLSLPIVLVCIGSVWLTAWLCQTYWM